MMTRSLLKCLVAGVASICMNVGCGGDGGPPLGTVTGKVTVDGQPVPRLHVTFVPEGKGSPSYGGTNENGEYHLLFHHNRKGAQLGGHHVLIAAQEQETDEGGNPIFAMPTARISRKYRQPGLLKAEVKPGRNDVNFNLDGKAD